MNFINNNYTLGTDYDSMAAMFRVETLKGNQ